jgi:hypothetical protein
MGNKSSRQARTEAPQKRQSSFLQRQKSIIANKGAIPDFRTLDELLAHFRECSIIEDMNIIIGIDATGSNKTSGLSSFGRSLHSNSPTYGPYAETIRLLKTTLEFDSDHIFPLYYFGSLQANNVGGALHVGNYPTVEGLLDSYLKSIDFQKLSGPTTFAPLIREAISIVKETERFHLLIIISDGQISKDLKQEHINLLREVANHPLSIVCIGVGDGPFDDMVNFDDNVAGRVDIFNFVNYNKVCGRDDELMLQVLMEVPDHYYSAQQRLGYTPKYGPLTGKSVMESPPVYF